MRPVTLALTLTLGFETSREAVVESVWTPRLYVVLIEPATLEPALPEKTARSRSGDVTAANDVWQLTASLWLKPATGTFTHPAIAALPLSKGIVSEGGR